MKLFHAVTPIVFSRLWKNVLCHHESFSPYRIGVVFSSINFCQWLLGILFSVRQVLRTHLANEIWRHFVFVGLGDMRIYVFHHV
jgi:hypothetical protein